MLHEQAYRFRLRRLWHKYLVPMYRMRSRRQNIRDCRAVRQLRQVRWAIRADALRLHTPFCGRYCGPFLAFVFRGVRRPSDASLRAGCLCRSDDFHTTARQCLVQPSGNLRIETGQNFTAELKHCDFGTELTHD